MAIKPKGNKVTGTKNNDKITWISSSAWKKALTVNALNGNDVINFKKSTYKNKLNGGNGNDTIYGGSKIDTIDGGSGNDVLYGNGGNDILIGRKGSDKIYTGAGNDVVRLYNGDGVDTLYKGSGSDTLQFCNYANLTALLSNLDVEQSGNDLKLYYTKNDCVILKNFFTSGTSVKYLADKSGRKYSYNSFMSSVKFHISGNQTDSSTIKGTKYNDVITAGSAGDIIYGNGGNDKIIGGSGNDTIYGGDGNDTIFCAGSGHNEIYGGNGDDIITTDNGYVVVDAGNGNNYINSFGTGNVTLLGGDGDNTVITNDVYKQIELGNGDNYLRLKNKYTSVTVGDGSNDISYKGGNGGDYFATIAGNGTNRIQVGDNDGYAGLSYAEATVGDGNNNEIYLYSNGHGVIHVGDGSGNRIDVRGIGSVLNAYVGNGNSNYIEIAIPSSQYLYIGNGSNNEITVEGKAYAQIRTGVDNSGNLLESDKVGSSYIYAGYKDLSTCTETTIHSGGNDTICTVGTADILLRNSNSSKTICTNFTEADGGENSIMRVSYDSSNGFTGGLQIKLQNNIASFMPYYSLTYNDYDTCDLTFAALDADGNVLDNSIVLKDAFTQQGALYGSYVFKYDADKLFVDSSNNYHSLSEFTQIYNMTTDTFHTTELPYYRSDKLVINSTNGDDTFILVGGETVNLKGSTSIKSLNVIPDYLGTEVNLNGIMNVNKAILSFSNPDIKDFVFSHYFSYDNLDDDGNGTGYIKIYGRDENGNILGEGSKIYGTWENYCLDLDNDVIGAHGSDGKADIDNILGIYNHDHISYQVSDMTQYVDMAIYDENVHFDIESASNNLYHIGSGKYFVQGSENDDAYWWEFAGDVTINEKAGNDKLTINAGYDSAHNRMGYQNVKFLFDVSVTRDDENNIISTSVGDDLIFAGDFYGNSEFDKLFSTDASTRNSVTTLTVNDYFSTNGSSMDTIELQYQIGTDVLYDTLDYDALMASVDNNEILQAVTAWLANHTDYASVTDAIANCNDAEALAQLAQCYKPADYSNYWIS